ncbi:MAG TPA: hypothetical protein VFZ34_00040 [Blastocatellia bacterium]|nr:hypothetical protein [Blastocatellia bacterium]
MLSRSTSSFVWLAPNSAWNWSLWRRWIIANALGELLGLGFVAALAGAVVWRFGEPRTSLAVLLMTALMILLGACEGLLIGGAQWWAVHPFLRVLPRQEWMKATTLGAVLAWGLGMIPSTLLALQETTIATPPAEISDTAKYVLAALMGLALGLTLGVPQWLVLRQYVRHAAWWIGANAVAWAVGMPLVFVAASSVTAGTSVWLVVLWITMTLLIAGAVVGALHGIALAWLLKQRAV